MATETISLDEELARMGVVGSYLWKPNRLYVKDADIYKSVDVVSDGTVEQVTAAVTRAGEEQISAIRAKGQDQIAALAALEKNYDDYKNNLIQTYTRMKNYYTQHGMVALSTIMSTAIANLNNL